MPTLQVLSIKKRKIIAGGLNRHITRVQWVDGELVVWVPCNADPERTKDNVELVSREFTDLQGVKRTLSLQEAVNKRINEAGIKPRNTQNRCIEIVFSGSPEVLCKMSREEVLNWAKDTLEWSRKTWGEENVVSASLHLDEKTPHIHMIVVPIVQGQSRRTKKQKQTDKEKGVVRESYKIDHNKPRLCVNEVFTTPLLYYYHDHYALEVSNKYGLERGLRAEPGNKKRHQDSEDYNRRLAAETREKKAILAGIEEDYETTTEKVEDAKKQLRVAEERKTVAEQQAAEKESKVKKLDESITKRETRISELDVSIEEKSREESEGFQLKDALDKYNDKLTEENQNLEATIETNRDTIKEQSQLLSQYRDAELKVQNKINQLKSLSSLGLMKMIQSIPDLIKADIQERVNKCWKGEVVSWKETTCKVGDEEQNFVEVHINFNQKEYYIEVRQKDGLVWKDGDTEPYKRKNGDTMYMPELASYFREEVDKEAKELVASLYRKPEVETVWECKLNFDECRIIKKPDGKYELQRKEWDPSKIGEDGKYTTQIWVKSTGFKSFKELRRDNNYAMLKVVHSDGKVDYINQYGNKLNNKQLKSIGVGSGYTQSM